MGKISSYSTSTPILQDMLIGTNVKGVLDGATKNFLLSDIQALFNLTTNTLSDVLTAGNTATANIVLTGNITASGIISCDTVTATTISSNIGVELLISGLPIYANQAAADAGLLPTNGIYKTATGELRISV